MDLSLRGLLHDVEHGLSTLSALVEVVRGDPTLSLDAGIRLAHAGDELARLLDLIATWVAEDTITPAPDTCVDVRALAQQVGSLAALEHGGAVDLAPGPEVTLPVSAALLWRVLANMVDNAARAAGRHGHVRIAVHREPAPNAHTAAETVIEVTDDGPGFGHGPRGRASVGLTVVTGLLDSVGARFEVLPAAQGARVRVVFPDVDPQRSAAGLDAALAADLDADLDADLAADLDAELSDVDTEVAADGASGGAALPTPAGRQPGEGMK